MAVLYYNRDESDRKIFSESRIKILYVSRAENETAAVPTSFHSHEKNLELQYIFGGRATIIIGNHVYEVRKGDVVVYNAGVLHDERPDAELGFSFYNCGIKNFKAEGLPENHLLPEDVSPVLHTAAMADCVQMIFRELVEQIANKKTSGASICQNLLNALLTILIEQIPHDKNLRGGKFDSSFLLCKEFIDEHFTETITIEQLSKIANMSISGFSHQFKKTLGIAPFQYLTRLRIGLAQKILISTDKPIADVATEVGYDNISHFNNQFKKLVGTSPQNYRKLWVGNEQFKNLNHIYDSLMKN